MRKITVISSADNSKKTIQSNATTLGELKSELTANNINTVDKAFYEGVSRTELVDDASVLPSNIPFKGTTTNDLLIYITTANKKIKSGAMTRVEVYAIIKDNNDLKRIIVTKCGRSYTNVPTDLLEQVVTEYLTPSTENNAGSDYDIDNCNCFLHVTQTEVESAVCTLTRMIVCMGASQGFTSIMKETLDCAKDTEDESSKEVESSFSDEEIAEMLSNR